jgi:hypothetical protein
MMGGLGLRVKNSLEQAKPLPADRPAVADFATLRYPRDPRPVPLNALTIDWILYLPAEVRPQLLGKRFPRIANILAAAWLRPEKFKARLHGFMHDKRGNRLTSPTSWKNWKATLIRCANTARGTQSSNHQEGGQRRWIKFWRSLFAMWSARPM